MFRPKCDTSEDGYGRRIQFCRWNELTIEALFAGIHLPLEMRIYTFKNPMLIRRDTEKHFMYFTAIKPYLWMACKKRCCLTTFFFLQNVFFFPPPTTIEYRSLSGHIDPTRFTGKLQCALWQCRPQGTLVLIAAEWKPTDREKVLDVSPLLHSQIAVPACVYLVRCICLA